MIRFRALLLLAATSLAASPPPTAMDERSLEEGRRQYEVMVQNSKLPRYGGCWKEGLGELQTGCGHLTDDEQSYLALKFANCFLEKAGMKTFPCQRGENMPKCLEGVSNNAYNTFAQFFTHTQNMCYFLQSQIWHDETSATIGRLSSASARVAEAVMEAAQIQETIVDNQKQTLEYQKQIAANGSLLSKAIELSRHNVREILEEFKSSTHEQKTLIFEIFDRVSKLQNLVVSEVSWLYTVIFYGFSLLVVYLVTATKRTGEARLWLYLALTVNFLMERFICYLSLSDGDHELTNVDMSDLPETIYHRIWLIRKLTLFTCFTVSGYFAFNFVDYNRVNNQLLEDIRRQNADLKQKMEMVQVMSRGKMADDEQPGKRWDLTDGMKDSEPYSGTFTDTGDMADEESDDDDTLSFNSTQTDRTWMGANEQDLPSEESSDEEGGLAMEESFLTGLNGTPPSVQGDDIENVTSGTPARRGPGSNRKSRSCTPVTTRERHSYNLRSRISTNKNPIVDTESPDTFARAVMKMSGIAQRNSAKIRMALKNFAGEDRGRPETIYSSDEN